MPILSSQILKVYPPMPSGARVVKERHTFDSGRVWDHKYITAIPDHDLDAELAANAVKYANFDAEEEIEVLFDSLKGKVVSDATAQINPQNVVDREVLFRYMTISDIDDFRTGLDFFDAVSARGGANANARASYLEIPRSKWDLIDKRFNDLRGSLIFIDDNKNQVWVVAE